MAVAEQLVHPRQRHVHQVFDVGASAHSSSEIGGRAEEHASATRDIIEMVVEVEDQLDRFDPADVGRPETKNIAHSRHRGDLVDVVAQTLEHRPATVDDHRAVATRLGLA